MKALCFDTETSGLVFNRSLKIDRQPHIIEFYGCIVDFRTGEIERELDLLIRPPLKLTKEIIKITKITDEMLQDAPVFSQVADDIAKMIEGAELVIAHNASFDQEITDIEFERLGKTIQWPKLLCTVEATVHLNGFRLSLTALHEKLFGKPFPEAHRAKHDVQALTRCCVELYKRGEI